MFKSSRKKLIAIGCSYTHHNLRSFRSPNLDFDFPRWPQYLADMLDMECVNLGNSGQGNEYMLAKVLDVIDEKNIGLVVIMWSEWPRLDFETGEGYLGWNTFHPHRANSLGKFPINIEAKQNISKYLNFKAKSMKSLRTFFLAQELLKNVQYLMIQGTEEFAEDVSFGKLADGSFKTFKAGPADHEIGIKEFISHPLFKKIDENKFIGWPIFKRIGGYNIDSLLDKLDPSGKIYRMSMEDTHPNKKGHQYIGEMLFNEYKNIYL